MTRNPDKNRIAIAGAGPVGMVSALAMARSGLPVTVFEATETASTASRASTFHPPTLEILAELGVIDQLLETGLVAPVFQYRDWTSGPIAELDLGLLSGDTIYPFRLQCEQQVLTEIVLDELTHSDLDVELCFRSPVVGYAHKSDSVEVHIGSETDYSERTFRLLIGADGAHSKVREASGVEFAGLTYPERYLVATTKIDLRSVMPDIAYVNYVTGRDSWCAVIRTHRMWRVLFPAALEESDASVCDPESVQARLNDLAPRDLPYSFDDVIVYFIHQRLVASMRIGERVLLAGDSAHLNNPLGGLGMNSGIHDAFFLSQAVARWWKTSGDHSSLDAYASVRRQVCGNFVNLEGDKNWSALRDNSDVARELRYHQLRTIAADRAKSRELMLRTSMIESVRHTKELLDF